MKFSEVLLLTVIAVLACAFPSLQQPDTNFLLSSEAVPADTLRIIALGTGTPTISRSQAATSYLLQLGSSSKNVLFDVGTGSIANLYSTQVNLGTVDTVFLSHLHSDHITDLAPLYALASNRSRPLTVYGPSGEEPATGTAATVQGLQQFLGWDQKSRNHVQGFPASYQGNKIVAHEFDYSAENQLVFEGEGYAVHSNPAFHYDTPGPVSLRLEWNNISVTYSGDTIPLNTFLDFAADSDVVIHESVGPIYDLRSLPPGIQNIMSNHTFQAEVGTVFNALQPRLAIATHLRATPYTFTPIVSGIRSVYTGPLAVATDFDVWDITSTAVVQRRYVPVNDKAGYEFNQHPQEYVLFNQDVATELRPAIVAGNLTVLRLAASTS